MIERKRYWEIDFLRGFCVLLMIFDHLMYSAMDVLPAMWDFFGIEYLAGFSDFAAKYWVWAPRVAFHHIISTLFFVLCGISCTFSRSNLKRGATAFGVACAITFFTMMAESLVEGITIRFGVVHMLASAMLMYGLARLLGGFLKRIKPGKITQTVDRFLPAALGLTLLVLFFCLWGGFDFEAMDWVSKVEGGNVGDDIKSIFVYVNDSSFASSDYFPILPFACFVLLGSLVGEIVYHTRARDFASKLNGAWNKPVCFVGRHALVFYILHQVAIVALLVIIGVFAKIGG